MTWLPGLRRTLDGFQFTGILHPICFPTSICLNVCFASMQRGDSDFGDHPVGIHIPKADGIVKPLLTSFFVAN